MLAVRRRFLRFAVLSFFGPLLSSRAAEAEPVKGRFGALVAGFGDLEKSSGGRLGVCVFDTGSGEKAGHRMDERFPMCSTFKTLLAAAILKRVDEGSESLDRQIPVPAKPLIANSPLTEPHAGGAMSVADLCHAALTRSDNTAANLLLDALGGPGEITKFCRALGDEITRLDRMETALNECAPGDPRDTTSPVAIAGCLAKVLLGDVLAEDSRKRLTGWMVANKTGDTRLRAGLPEGWRAADKTGSDLETTTNDIACFWPPGGAAPVIVTAYLTQCPGPEDKRAAVLAEIGRRVVAAIGAP